MAKSSTAVDSIVRLVIGNDATDLLNEKDSQKSVVVLPVLYCLAASIGILFSLAGYMEPDSCWLIKLGQLTILSHAIPQADPFSFTLPLLAAQGVHQPFVVYQWLSEVLFAAAFRLADLKLAGFPNAALEGPLLLCTLVTTASVCILFRVCSSTKASRLFCLLMVALAVGAVMLRLMVRPEIFTLLFIALWLWLLQRVRFAESTLNKSKNPSKKNIDWHTVGCLNLVMIAWSNFHSGFVIGITALAVYALCFLFQDLVARAGNGLSLSAPSRNALAALATCSLGTLINPYGIGLWQYLPTLFFSPLNRLLDELSPVSLNLFSQPIYYPFFLLVVVSAVVVMVVVVDTMRSRTDKASAASKIKMFVASGKLTSVSIVIAAIVVSIFCRRLISPLAFFTAVETCILFAALRPSQLYRMKVSILSLELPVTLISIVSILIASDRLVPLTMPQTSDTFQPSFKSVEYLWDHWQSGNVFNTLQIGSLLSMYGPPKLKIFADTRIDVFGQKILKDYATILFARPNYEKVLLEYRIEWVIVSPENQLSAALGNAPGWRKEYEDASAVIFRKR